MADTQDSHTRIANGPAIAAFLAAGIGAFAMGFVVILNEAGLFTAPALYGPAGGVSGRTAIAVAIWLIAWAVLHSRWKDRDMATAPITILTVALIGMGVLLCFPPVWSML